MPISPSRDALDHRIIAALQLNGRASWKQVAVAVGANESTVARRGQHLLDSGLVSVTGVLDHLRCGLGSSLYVRMRSRPGRANDVAADVAGLASTRFVTVVTGSSDIVAEFVVPTHRDAARIIVEELPRPDELVETETMLVLRKFSAVEEWDTQLLSPEAAIPLRSKVPLPHSGHRDWHEPEQLSAREFAIVAVLADDGRSTYSQVAERVGVSESTVGRRIESLMQRGCLRFRTLFETSLIGLDVEFLQWLSVDPSQVEHVGLQLAKEPSTRMVSATSGRFNLLLHGTLRGYGDLYHYTTDAIGSLPGVHTADITLQVQTLKRAWVRIEADGTRAREGER